MMGMSYFGGVQQWTLERTQVWKLKRCWLPKKCFLSGKRIWGELAYRGTLYITGPGDPVVETHWINQQEFLLWQLKRKRHGTI